MCAAGEIHTLVLTFRIYVHYFRLDCPHTVSVAASKPSLATLWLYYDGVHLYGGVRHMRTIRRLCRRLSLCAQGVTICWSESKHNYHSDWADWLTACLLGICTNTYTSQDSNIWACVCCDLSTLLSTWHPAASDDYACIEWVRTLFIICEYTTCQWFWFWHLHHYASFRRAWGFVVFWVCVDGSSHQHKRMSWP